MTSRAREVPQTNESRKIKKTAETYHKEIKDSSIFKNNQCHFLGNDTCTSKFSRINTRRNSADEYVFDSDQHLATNLIKLNSLASQSSLVKKHESPKLEAFYTRYPLKKCNHISHHMPSKQIHDANLKAGTLRGCKTWNAFAKADNICKIENHDQPINWDNWDKLMQTNHTWEFEPSATGSSELMSNSQLINNLKYGLGLKEAFFSSASFRINLTVTVKICKMI